MARLSRVNRPTLPAPSRGGGRRPRERAGRWGWLAYSQEKTFPVKRRRQGRGIFHPLPVSPTPWGRFPHRYGFREQRSSPRLSLNPQWQTCFPRGTVSAGQSPYTAPPSRTHRVVGVVDVNRSTRDAGDSGSGSSIPRGGDSSSIHCQEHIQYHSDCSPSLVGRRSAGVFRKILLKNPGSVPDTVSSRRFPLTAQPATPGRPHT